MSRAVKAPAVARRLPVGAEPHHERGVHFRIWAPKPKTLELVVEGRDPRVLPLEREEGGYWSGWAHHAGAGTLYRFRVDGEGPYPDPASRYQPFGPHGPSQVVDPEAFRWTDRGWKGRGIAGQVLYELHVGTFTPEGTWEAAAKRLPKLQEVGITTIEVMPVADFPGRFGWGYDGVSMFAPTRLYGSPDDFRGFVDRAHALGLGVILDVVYNHFGPDGNYVGKFAEEYESPRHKTDWGPALNYDAEGRDGVREFVRANAAHWIAEYHLDGLRLDATQNVYDDSEEHVLADIGRSARAAAGRRRVILVAENEEQKARIARPLSSGGYGHDGIWNDDFHHAACVSLTGLREAYLTDYAGTAQELLSCLKRGFLYQGQRFSWQKQRRGSPARDLPAAAFVHYLENHDQLANHLPGHRRRLDSSPSAWRALTAVLLLGPETPMLFQGQEFGATSPWLYFADHGGELGRGVREGRRKYLAQFPSYGPEADPFYADPLDPGTFERCKLDWSERERHGEWLALHRDLLKLRREDPAFAAQDSRALEGAVLAPDAFVARFAGPDGADRLLVVNLGPDMTPRIVPEPLLAPPEGRAWRRIWHSEHPSYGGSGSAEPEDAKGRWRLTGSCASVLAAETA